MPLVIIRARDTGISNTALRMCGNCGAIAADGTGASCGVKAKKKKN